MEEWTADKLADRIFDLRLLDTRQLESVWTEFGTRNVSCEDFQNSLLRRELLTNFQLNKVLRGDRDGYFYGNYRVLYIAGTGTFARVFRSVNLDTGQVVALKVLRRRYRDNPEQVELFLREARMGLRLRHENIVRVYEVSDTTRAPYFVMEFVEGQTLRDMLRMRKKLDVATALNFITGIVAGLDHARKRGITHRDMKLSNVLVTSTAVAKLVDFGLATISETSDDLLTASPNARSIDYVALERGTGVRKNDHRSDIYFAGCIFYHMLTGVAPLLETRDRLVRMNISRFHEVKPINQLDPEVPLAIASIVNRAMALNPDERYQEPEEMLGDLKRVRYVLEKGEDANVPIEAAAGQQAGGKRRIDQEGKGLTVMCIESNAAMQNVLREKLKKRGYRVLITADPARAIQRFEDDVNVADCAIFSTQTLGPQAVAAFNRLGASRFTADVPAILLVDKRQQGLIDAAETSDHRVLLPMPLKMRQLRSMLARLLAAKRKA